MLCVIGCCAEGKLTHQPAARARSRELEAMEATAGTPVLMFVEKEIQAKAAIKDEMVQKARVMVWLRVTQGLLSCVRKCVSQPGCCAVSWLYSTRAKCQAQLRLSKFPSRWANGSSKRLSHKHTRPLGRTSRLAAQLPLLRLRHLASRSVLLPLQPALARHLLVHSLARSPCHSGAAAAAAVSALVVQARTRMRIQEASASEVVAAVASEDQALTPASRSAEAAAVPRVCSVLASDGREAPVIRQRFGSQSAGGSFGSGFDFSSLTSASTPAPSSSQCRVLVWRLRARAHR